MQTGLLFTYVSRQARLPTHYSQRLFRALVDERLDVWPRAISPYRAVAVLHLRAVGSTYLMEAYDPHGLDFIASAKLQFGQ